jgi:hypothetical protein
MRFGVSSYPVAYSAVTVTRLKGGGQVRRFIYGG